MDIQGRLTTFRDLRPKYGLLAEYLQAHMRQLTAELEIYPILMGRPKSVESFAEKIGRKGKSYVEPLTEMTDLCGVRVIVHILKQVDALAASVVATAARPDAPFRVDRGNSENKAALLDVKSFGYLSDHYILVMESFPPVDGFKDPNKLRQLTELRDELAKRGGQLRAELQIRTLAQHVWADIYHELGYKNEFKLPQRWEREFARVAAMLEGCDRSFQEISDAMMGAYGSGYSAFMDRDELGRLADTLEQVLATVDAEDRGFPKTAHRLLKTYIALGDKEALAKMLATHEQALSRHVPAMRDMGVALCQIHKPGTDGYRHGQELLEEVVKRSPDDIDARCSLAGSLRKEADPKRKALARLHYRDAHRLAPTDPYPLGNYIAEELQATGDQNVLDYLQAVIPPAMQRCEKQIDVQINLPWAYFDLGLFELYLQRPGYRYLHHYARGMVSSTQPWMLRTAHGPIEALAQRGLTLQGLGLLERLLNVAWWIKTPAGDRCPVEKAFPPADARHPRLVRRKLREPVVVVAGWGDDEPMSEVPLLDALRTALEGFKGTLVSGGTATGVSGLVAGTAASRPADVTAVGYLPKARRALADARCSIKRFTEGKDFSPLDPLAFYEDWAIDGGAPDALRLLGIGGGEIAACEYRIALALGVRVGLVEGSGGAADELLNDPRWAGVPNLVRLSDKDPDPGGRANETTPRVFLQPEQSATGGPL
jgi:ppGpp synthetase/RelA/SpoT-type nucleotidyltranferase